MSNQQHMREVQAAIRNGGKICYKCGGTRRIRRHVVETRHHDGGFDVIDNGVIEGECFTCDGKGYLLSMRR